ncbi:MAG TPA: glycosyltransferase [Gemmatimonadaceae bacterium]|nr:glycosyltransferase [Gemmatimonadaceae bacterium]
MKTITPLRRASGVLNRTASLTPFFESGPRSGDSTKRLLLISYAFPPTNHIGAVRWYQMSRFAAQRGWSLDVIMTDLSDEDEKVLDWSPLESLPAGMRLFGIGLREHPVLRVGSLAVKALRWGGLLGKTTASAPVAGQAPDGQLRTLTGAVKRATLARFYFDQAGEWIERAVALALALHREKQYDAVASSGPPHMVHLAARRVARFLGLPFLADLRDPIAFDEVVPPDFDGPAWRQEVQRWEKVVVRDADIVAANTEEVRRLLVERYPDAAARIVTVRNGADSDFVPPYVETPTFVLAHTGSIYWGRDPRPLLEAAGRVAQRLRPAPNDFRVVFTGDISYNGTPLQPLAEHCGLGPYFEAHPPVPRKEVLHLLGSASVVVTLPQPQWYSIPAKLYEYVQLRAWVLALCEPGSAVHSLLQGTSAITVSPRDVNAIEKAIESCFIAFKNSGRPAPVNYDGRFDRSHQATKLFDALENASLRKR